MSWSAHLNCSSSVLSALLSLCAAALWTAPAAAQELQPYQQEALDVILATADPDVEILGGSYAHQDGRYHYDFSQVKRGFDRRAEPVRQRLEDALQALAPAGNGAMFQALLAGERIN